MQTIASANAARRNFDTGDYLAVGARCPRFSPAETVRVLKKFSKNAQSSTQVRKRDVRASEAKPGISNLLTILSLATGKAVPELEKAYEGKGYGEFKADVAEAVVELFAPVRERYAELVADPAHLDAVLVDGASRAREVAADTMSAVRERVGLLAPA